MGFYLLENANPTGAKYYPTRNSAVKYIVVHTAENLPDLQPPDLGAESVARYLAGTDRDASCHECVDTDSYVSMLPDDYTAWHAKGYNSNGWGLEICTQAAKWADLPPSFRDVLYRMSANRARRAALALGVPLRKTTAGGPAGFLGHTEVDPGRRSDPGKNFDWGYFMALVNNPDTGVTAPPAVVQPAAPPAAPHVHPPMQVPNFPLPAGWYFGPKTGPKESVSGYFSYRADLQRWQQRMKDRGWNIGVDGLYGPGTAEVATKFQREKGLVVDGKIGANTWRAAWNASVT